MNLTAQNQPVDILIEKQITQSKTPSLQYKFFDQNQVLYEKTLGLANIANNTKTSSKHAYRIFSVTKTFTALAILQLVEKGQIDLDQSVIFYLPTFPYGSDITIRQLLTHTAGIPSPMPLNWIHLEEEHHYFDPKAFFKDLFIKHNKVKSGPNSKFKYSNLAYVILGQVIKEVSGINYEKYIEQHIIYPLGIIEEMSFDINNPMAVGYQKKRLFTNLLLGFFIDKRKYMGKQRGKWSPFKEYFINGSSYGGLVSTANGLMIYLQELLKPNSSLISDEYKQLLFKENYTVANEATGMCLSWFVGSLNGKKYYTHAGGGGGYYCEVRIYPDLGVGSLIMFNRSGMKDERFLDQLDSHFLGQMAR
jgi:CubicO group peptidase (beta-lactamase class C family)